jgi:hypothetical protein
MKAIINYFPLLLIICFAGCKKDSSTENPEPLLIPQEVKDYMMFQPGTYWVYIDSVSGRVDSLYVTETKHEFDTLVIGSYPKRVYEIFVVKSHSSMDGYDYTFEVNTTYSANDNDVFDLFEEKFKPGDYAGQTLWFIYKPYVGQIFYEGNATKMVKNIYPIFKLNNSVYYNVIEVYHDISAIDVSNHVTNYFASKFGIIRKELLDSNQVWNLARSNIIQ